MKRILSMAEVLIIIVLAIIPLLATFPYRINIFLSWEGAYRMAEGQLPYKDFGMPVGYMYWVIPAIFFKIFGAQMITLIKAQVFINIISGLAFRSIFKTLNIQPGIRFAGVLAFCLSYSFLNYWPWYNHTVIVYELISLAFLMKFIFSAPSRKRYVWLVLSAVFVFFSFFTKQDGGALALLICFVLIAYHCYHEKEWLPLVVFIASVISTALIMILPFAGEGFGYWFNRGQPPHSSRISIGDILGEFLGASQWIKFYLLIIAVLLLATVKNFKVYIGNKQQIIFLLLTLGILAQATVFQVTSYVPEDNNIFFHGFAIIFILSLLASLLPIDIHAWKATIIFSIFVGLWWSHVYWRYIERFVLKPGDNDAGTLTHGGYTYSNEVNRNTFMIEMDTTDIPLNNWRVPTLYSFEKILLPGPTVDGIERLMNMNIVKTNKNLKVLNMTELTPLAAEIPFDLEKGSYYPLWYHKGVSMFDKETELFVNRIKNNHYDLVLYEYIPYLNNFYPYKVREALMINYQRVDRFVAPKKPATNAWIEVYVRK